MMSNFLHSLCACFYFETEEDYIELLEFEPKEETFSAVSGICNSHWQLVPSPVVGGKEGGGHLEWQTDLEYKLHSLV